MSGETMNAIVLRGFGGPEVMGLGRVPMPEPGPEDILVRVRASALNRADTLQRMGLYPAPPGDSEILGLELAGEVVRWGSSVSGFAEGQRVFGLVGGGGYAEYALIDHKMAMPIPDGWDFLQAAAVPEVFFTAHETLFVLGALAEGDAVLIHAGGSGVGTAAIQVASRLGSRVMATAGTPEKCAACEELGAERCVNYREEDFVEAAKEFGGGKAGDNGVNVILDMVGGDYVARNIRALARDGRLVNIAYLKGSKVEVDLLPVMLKRLTLTGSTLRPQSVERKGEIADALKRRVWPLIESGEIRPVIHATFPLHEAADAHRLMESGVHIGKIVLRA